MNNITRLRERTIRAIQAESLLWDERITVSDRVLDDLARVLLDLPRRPEGDNPYVGWLMPTEKITGFNGSTFAAFCEGEAKKQLVWIPNGEAVKYTKPFEKIGFRGRFAWCAAFVRWCLVEYGVDVPIMCDAYSGYSYALCESFQKLAQQKGWYLDNVFGVKPKPGDLVLFDWGQRNINEPDTDWEDHIGVYLSQVDNNRFRCAEGNTRNQSGIFTRYYSSVQGYVRIPEGTKKL